MEVPVSDPSTVEGTVLLQGQPVLIHDTKLALDRLHPYYRELVAATGTKAFLSVPLKVNQSVLGSLTVDRGKAHSLSQEDLDLMVTFANQLAIALDNLAAYHKIEELNIGLEQKVSERTAQLEEANKQLNELNQLKSAFVSVVSHELRTPMTSIKAFVDNMLEGFTGSLNEKQTQYLTRIQANIERLTGMVGDLLDLSRIESGRIELRKQPHSADELINEIIEGLQPYAAGKSIRLAVDASAPDPNITVDRDKFTQILTNLIGNAIKFTPQGGTILVKTSETGASNGLQICVADTGCGIPHEELPKVFEKFYRGSAQTGGVAGAGLGLAIVKSLVELHGGQVWAESTEGRGSSFFFIIPRSQE